MNRVGTASISILGSLAITTLAAAQAGDPPPPPPPPPPPAATPAPAPPGVAPAPVAPAPAAPAPVAPGAPPAAGAPPGPAAPAPVTAGAGASVRTDLDADTWGTAPPASREAGSPEGNPEGLGDQWRRASLQLQTGISGSTGLLRVTQAGSGAPGTFRLSLMTSIFSGSGVLCNSSSPRPSSRGEAITTSDDLDAMTAHLGISATILPFLEGYLGFHNRATSDTRSRPQLLQVLGDTNIGLKGFMPATPDQLFFAGGEAELWLLNGTGGVGLDGGGTSFALRALATLDANNRINPADRIPVRAHLNLAYKFDNSANLVSDLESTPPPNGRGARISRIERFGLGINRVDFFQFGIGGEYVHPVIRPFLEWTLDIPLNRKSYVCKIDEATSHGDSCLKLEEGIGISPSRLTLGAKLLPWEGRGLALTAAFDVGTTATSTFIDETVPELPWNLWLGVSYAVDTEPPKPIVQRVNVPAPAQAAPTIERIITGKVVEKGSLAPVPNALVRYDGRPITGMITDETGSFRSTNLQPGTYTFNVSATGYKDGQCAATVTAGPATPPPAAPNAAGLPPQPIAPGQAPTGQNQVLVPLSCELESLPKLGSVIGSLIDGETNSPVAGARIKAEDRKNRVLELPGDSSGQFKVTNIPPGRLRLSIDAPGYFATTADLDVRALEDVQARIVLNKRPAQPNVVVAGNEVKLKKQVHFATDSAEILPDSMALLEEIADVLKGHQEISAVEVQGHTDNTGTQPHNLRLSQDRAQAVADALARLGVDSSRLTAKGYGQEKPILPNTSEPNRARNRRVQLMIQKK